VTVRAAVPMGGGSAPGGTRPTRRDVLGSGLAVVAACAGLAARAGFRPAEPDRPFHLGLVTYNAARDWDLDTILAVCQEVGLEGVEFRTTHRHGVEPSLDAGQRASVRDRCRKAGLLQVSLGTTCEFHSPDAAEVRRNVEECTRFVTLAHDIGARGVKVRPNGLPPGVPRERTVAQIGRALAECGASAGELGVEIWMEVHGRDTQVPASARAIMDACGHPNVGVTWNSNPTDVVSGSIRPSFDLLRPFIRCCHISDLWSDYPYAELFALLTASGYDRFTLCEYGQPVDAAEGPAFLRRYKERWLAL
jgi:sugar phosphate isomerase/epimerase